jgi:hypothetical protein
MRAGEQQAGFGTDFATVFVAFCASQRRRQHLVEVLVGFKRLGENSDCYESSWHAFEARLLSREE